MDTLRTSGDSAPDRHFGEVDYDTPRPARVSVPPATVSASGEVERVVVRRPVVMSSVRDVRIQAVMDARARGYEGDACGECGAMTMVRNGSCLKCVSCGSTSGCS